MSDDSHTDAENQAHHDALFMQEKRRARDEWKAIVTPALRAAAEVYAGWAQRFYAIDMDPRMSPADGAMADFVTEILEQSLVENVGYEARRAIAGGGVFKQ